MALPLRLSANLGFLWADLPLLDRIEQAALAGFHAIEMHWPYDVPARHVRDLCDKNDLAILSINTPQGDVSRGDSGLAAQPGRTREFQEAFEVSLGWALESGASMIHVLPGNRSADVAASTRCLVDNLVWAAERAGNHGITLLLEALNQRDKPGYFYHSQEDANDIRLACMSDNIKLMFDVYHVGIAQGDILNRLTRLLPHIAHIQVAGVPDRHEPDLGEVRYEVVFEHLVKLGYSGWIGCEYRPSGDLLKGLRRWLGRCDLSL